MLAWTGDELSRGQAQNGVKFDFEVKFDLECQGQLRPKTIGILTQVFYTYGPNSVVLAWTGDELWRGKASDYRTHGRTDGHTDRHRQRKCPWPKLASGKKQYQWIYQSKSIHGIPSKLRWYIYWRWNQHLWALAFGTKTLRIVDSCHILLRHRMPAFLLLWHRTIQSMIYWLAIPSRYC